MKVPIEPVGFRIDEPSEGLRFVIPQKWRWVVFAPGSLAPKVFISFFSLVWFTLFGLTILPWFWNLGGRHILVLNESEIALRQELFGIGRTKVFDVTQVSRWRYVPEQVRFRRPSLPSGFAFDFAGKEVRAGTAMEEAEVKQLFTQIRRRFPDAPWAPPTRMGA